MWGFIRNRASITKNIERNTLYEEEMNIFNDWGISHTGKSTRLGVQLCIVTTVTQLYNHYHNHDTEYFPHPKEVQLLLLHKHQRRLICTLSPLLASSTVPCKWNHKCVVSCALLRECAFENPHVDHTYREFASFYRWAVSHYTDVPTLFTYSRTDGQFWVVSGQVNPDPLTLQP